MNLADTLHDADPLALAFVPDGVSTRGRDR